MIYFNEQYLTIHWDEVNYCVWMEWKDFVDGEKFRTGVEKGLDLLKEKKAKRWLADTRNLKVISQADQKWVNENWFPRALAGGLERMALVVPESTIAKLSLNDIMKNVTDPRLETAYFDNVEDAKKWF